MNRVAKIAMWIVAANVALVPAVYFVHRMGWTAAPEAGVSGTQGRPQPAIPPKRQVEADPGPPDLSDPDVLEAYLAENSRLIRQLDYLLDPLIDSDRRVIAAHRGIEGKGCDLTMAVVNEDQTVRRSSIFPAHAIRAMERIPDGAGVMDTHVLRIHIAQTRPDFLEVPAVMIDDPSSPSRAGTSEMIPYLDMPHGGPRERDTTEARLRELKTRCEAVQAVRG
jgi:hypothetical protein